MAPAADTVAPTPPAPTSASRPPLRSLRLATDAFLRGTRVRTRHRPSPRDGSPASITPPDVVSAARSIPSRHRDLPSMPSSPCTPSVTAASAPPLPPASTIHDKTVPPASSMKQAVGNPAQMAPSTTSARLTNAATKTKLQNPTTNTNATPATLATFAKAFIPDKATRGLASTPKEADFASPASPSAKPAATHNENFLQTQASTLAATFAATLAAAPAATPPSNPPIMDASALESADAIVITPPMDTTSPSNANVKPLQPFPSPSLGDRERPDSSISNAPFSFVPSLLSTIASTSALKRQHPIQRNMPTPSTESTESTATAATSMTDASSLTIDPKVSIPNIFRLNRVPLRKESAVHVIAQVDVEDYMVKRTKVGTSTTFYVVLEGTHLSVLKNKGATPRQQVNVREKLVTVDVAARELRIVVRSSKDKLSNKDRSQSKDKLTRSSGKDKLLRLGMASNEIAQKWKDAVDSAVYGDITEQYTFVKTIGSGAYGEVRLATHNVSKEERAVKIIQKGSNSKSREHLESEIQVMKSIEHVNIVHTYQIFDLKKTIYIVMEYVPGGDLFDFVSQKQNITEKQASTTMHSIFKAVEHLHRNGVIHRDLKPENILCSNSEWPLKIKLSDFGFARIFKDNAEELTRTPVGTLYFMAPEILKVNGIGHSECVDTWACGVILYTILTGRLPFPGKNSTEYRNNVASGKLLFPPMLWRGISEDAKSLVRGLLNPDPEKRLTALGALQHRWVAWPNAIFGENAIKRDRSNLHSSNRQLLIKARKVVFAVAMANRFASTIPHMMDTIGDSSKIMGRAIESGVKKTAGGIEKGIEELASGVVKVGEGIGEGTRKVAGEIGEGTKKVAGGIGEGTKKVAGGIAGSTKKVAEGIGNGAKKTVHGVESGAKKVGEGMRKTADGIEKGVKVTAGGIGHGVKATADGIGHGVKATAGGIGHGVKATGGTLKRSVARLDRSRSTEEDRSQATGTDGEVSQGSLARRSVLKKLRLKHGSKSGAESAVSLRSGGVEAEGRSDDEQGEGDDDSEPDFYSALDQHSETDFGRLIGSMDGIGEDEVAMEVNISGPDRPLPGRELGSVGNRTVGIGVDAGKKGNRPKLAPLSGLTMGLSDESVAGSSPRAMVFAGSNDNSKADRLRTAALMLAMNRNQRPTNVEAAK